ncbi:hypothetical protein SUGI_0769460 [Cryptomeria japonica]|nr:hypothetical protein SUGI_0769460 [Cryptomeria japonica]
MFDWQLSVVTKRPAGNGGVENDGREYRVFGDLVLSVVARCSKLETQEAFEYRTKFGGNLLKAAEFVRKLQGGRRFDSGSEIFDVLAPWLLRREKMEVLR